MRSSLNCSVAAYAGTVCGRNLYFIWLSSSGFTCVVVYVRVDSADSIMSRAFCRISSRAFCLQRAIRHVAGDEEAQHEDAEQHEIEFPDELHRRLGSFLRLELVFRMQMPVPRRVARDVRLHRPAERGVAQARREAPLERRALPAVEPGLRLRERHVVIGDERGSSILLSAPAPAGDRCSRGAGPSRTPSARGRRWRRRRRRGRDQYSPRRASCAAPSLPVATSRANSRGRTRRTSPTPDPRRGRPPRPPRRRRRRTAVLTRNPGAFAAALSHPERRSSRCSAPLAEPRANSVAGPARRTSVPVPSSTCTCARASATTMSSSSRAAPGASFHQVAPRSTRGGRRPA